MISLPEACVVDASVGIKLFIQEEFSSDVQCLFERGLASPQESLFVPDLFFIECANILWKKVRRSEYQAKVAIENLRDLGSLELSSVPTAELMERALEIACSFGITAYDACYVALSERNQVPLLTADIRLVEALSADGTFNIQGLARVVCDQPR